MRLKHIKLAGFKSFVEPTKVPFEQQMTAIVGPNGCGKSNIIDAVRWVLGESSAKHLRGDAMTDVIFNGASTRKPVGQASVELLFDNVSSQIKGSMADRNQVSIRRVVNRDSQNTYYLNGSKCRRKDITDIFLGTGLGPRSYAIIEQGTISRLIESKPQELRVFIEEAAGISKYKERRRDTENRIRHTRENLARLTDIRLELEQQLDKLHQQAEAAKRFKTLKAQERTTKAELAALRWQKYDRQYQSKQQRIIEIQQQIAQQVARQHTDEQALVSSKKSVIGLNNDIQHLQQQKIQLTNNIARLEQQLKHSKQQQDKLQSDKTQYQTQIHQAQQALLAEQQQLETVNLKQEEQVLVFQSFEQQLLTVEQALASDNSLLVEQQQAWYQLQQQKEKYAQQSQELNNRRAKLESQQQYIQSRQVKISEQYHQLVAKEQAIKSSDNKLKNEDNDIILQQIETLELQLTDISNQVTEDQQQLLSINQRQSELQGTKNSLEKQVSALQQKLATKSDWQSDQQSWLAQTNQLENQLVQESITVIPGWELAAEMVLAAQLQANRLTDLPIEALADGQLPPTLNLIRIGEQRCEVLDDSMAKKISGAPEFIVWLNRIKTAENINQAIESLADLSEGESVICPQGLWLSTSFIRYGIAQQKNDHLVYQQEANVLTKELSAVVAELKQCLQRHGNIQTSLQSKLSQQQEITHQLQQKREQSSQWQQQQKLQQQVLQQLNEQLQRTVEEKQQLAQEMATINENLASLAQSVEKMAQHDDAENAAEHNVQVMQQTVQKLQQQVQDQQRQQQSLIQQKHQAELNLEKTGHQVQQLKHSIVRMQESIKQLTKQQANNAELLQQNVMPVAKDQQQLELWLVQMEELEQQLTSKQSCLRNEQQTIEQIEQKQRLIVEMIGQLKEQLNQLQLESESCRLKAAAALELLQESGKILDTVLENMPEHAKESIWQVQLSKLAKDIQRLGAINLAAIEEFDSQLTRKNYLDQQDQDLNLAITTLESAIEKIDKESRQKFKVTFDKVNQDLQSLFPKVFGGGSAYLSLTDDDLLETGITIMARPPGKKNSTIHLLSGGEKALTALSLVFAIFRLNPAPFCMLDEVDAPLDDANVARFCNLVEEMSQSVQFIYISHNKIAMEMASHLAGVTMFEAGVSRMVSVDIDEAIAMAEVS
ncbi:chromosome partition protein Smc [Thalassotalea insulae]|uniref:Chromosome partition protein Smc n=1 Tax=Thalassotalea insulae TaxID=2056778 RepID=A0ABQ6GR38_9GAMM|nr:chromosome segregation protein SMC [Thalassotalea insulae]GLX76900.1 chromosome partition protein Smc [Thalassotalea insulae]